MSTAFDLSSQIDAAPDDHARFQLCLVPDDSWPSARA